MYRKLAVALLTTAWMTAGICAQHTSTVPASGNAPHSAIKKAVHAKKHGKRAKVARARKTGPVARDGDAEVLAQVLGSDNKNPLWGKPQQ
ncbi:signal peptide protein [Burkholderiaceae bacterium 26]|nr:signal peptide protein [Burkholderiaceae bacterium 26]